ncbi:nucleotide-diphospho-sugar transferase [Thozetella sp. PMI_491]|nr:nucleotide-diphospho-sugar transferase [Thozetella sp. PMI_491]
MSNKSARGGGAAKGKKQGKGGGPDEQREDILQAVILTDSFQNRFQPFSVETPRCLLPLANTPIIEYTLEFLAMNGVQQVFLYCNAHEDQIEAYINNSPRWSPDSKISPFSSIEFIRMAESNSIGDFLRDLDKRGYIEGDFILVHGDVVANIPLDAALARHRARREANRDACMTMLLRAGGQDPHRTKTKGISPLFFIDPSGRCLHYDEIHPLQADHHLILESTLLEHPEVEIRSDLIDCGIDICTPDVLALWSESFDYALPRKNFLHGVLKDWELNNKIIHAEIVDQGYAARASNLQMYEAISRDVLGRWTYPLVPDSNLVHGHSYTTTKGGISLEDGVSIGLNSEISNSALGRHSKIGHNSSLLNSTVGRGCTVGNNVKIIDSFIWDNVSIADNTTIERSILANSVVVGSGATIPSGSLLSFGVSINSGVSLPAAPPAAISLLSLDRAQIETDTSLVGPSGKGGLFVEPRRDSVEGEDEDPAFLQKSLIYSLAGLNLSSSSISTLASEDSFDSDDEGSRAGSTRGGDFTPTRGRLPSTASDDSAFAPGAGAFHSEAVHGLIDALRADDNGDFDSAKLEFMGLRLANNASDHAMRRAIAVAFATRASELASSEGGSLEPIKAAEQALTGKKGASSFIKDVGVGGDDVESQAEFALALQKALIAVKNLEPPRAGTLLAAMLQQLYNLDVLEEDGILAWWEDVRATQGDGMTTVKDKARVLVEWLENADEEDSDEDEDDSDEDDE